MFSVHVKVNLSSPLGRHLGFVQHLAALAMLQAIKTHSTCSQLDIRLKWPNDIYYCKRIKLAGLVVQSTMLGQTVHCFIGCGMNVSNSSPTTCLNDIIRNVSSENGAKATEFTVESVIAETLNQLDDLLVKFDQNGVSWAKDAYKANWMHNNQHVKLANGQDVVVDGVDDQGFLTVVNKETGQETTVCPDGNRFDMMSNMIVLKH
ncbi:Biotin--protein ligase [Halotydeus destructor]|nr:Biotin--protein ligase [Halotydeus destructor]